MKRIVMSSIVFVAVALFALATTGAVHAQSVTPVTPSTQTQYGLGGRGGMMGTGQMGILHDDVVAYISEQPGIS